MRTLLTVHTDGFNYHNAAGGEGTDPTDINGPTAVEIDCQGYWNGYENTGANNGTTMHDGGRILRINCTYDYNQNRTVADIDECEIWMLNCVASDPKDQTTPENSVNYAFLDAGNPTIKVWLDGCTSSGALIDLFMTGGEVRYRNMDISGWTIDNTGGVLEEY